MIELTADIPPQARSWRNERPVWEWCRQYTLLSEADHAKWLERIETDPTIKMFGIRFQGDTRGTGFLGVCGLTSIDRVNQSAEFSLYIEPSVRRSGCAGEALTQLLEHGFFDHNLNRIWGEVFAGNPAMRLFSRLGFREEGLLREAYFRKGKFIDAHRIALLRKDFCG